MFNRAYDFSSDVSNKWDVSKMETMEQMFYMASVFSSDVCKWNVSAVEDMSSLFWRRRSFTGDVSGSQVSAVT